MLRNNPCVSLIQCGICNIKVQSISTTAYIPIHYKTLQIILMRSAASDLQQQNQVFIVMHVLWKERYTTQPKPVPSL